MTTPPPPPTYPTYLTYSISNTTSSLGDCLFWLGGHSRWLVILSPYLVTFAGAGVEAVTEGGGMSGSQARNISRPSALTPSPKIGPTVAIETSLSRAWSPSLPRCHPWPEVRRPSHRRPCAFSS